MTTELIVGAFTTHLTEKKLRKLKARLEAMVNVYEHRAKVRSLIPVQAVVPLHHRRPDTAGDVINQAALQAAAQLREMIDEIEKRLEA